jgi:hypothetical protein
MPGGATITGASACPSPDTADVHLVEPFLCDFHRAGGTGTAVLLSSAR